jgi:hypothetical protein
MRNSRRVCTIAIIRSFSSLLVIHYHYLIVQALVEQDLKYDCYMSEHYQYYVREMRILAYAQLLESYSSLTIASMAKSFGVSEEFIDKYVHL